MPEQKPLRRVGTFTMGIALICSGLGICLWQFLPAGSIWNLLRYSPAFLVVLGIEVLLSSAASKNGMLKYDWLSMILCFFLIFACIAFSAFGTWCSSAFPL